MGKREKLKRRIKNLVSKPKNLIFGKTATDVIFMPIEVSALELQPWVDPDSIGHYQFDPNSFKSLDYSVCSALSDTCGDLGYLPGSNTFVMSDEAFCNFTSNVPRFVTSVADSLELTEKEAIQAVKGFFNDKTLLVQPKGFEGALYSTGGILQTGGVSLWTVKVTTSAKLVGVTGTKLISSQPLLLIGIPTLFGMAFTSAASLGNPEGLYFKTCMTMGRVFNLPMRGIEQVYNMHIAPTIYTIFGVKTTLNATQAACRGAGLNATEALRLTQFAQKKNLMKMAKDAILSFFK